MRRDDVYLISLDPALGHEQQGTRPVLVISPEEFNRITRLPIVLPITTGGKFVRTRGFAVSLEGCNSRTRGVIRCDQPRTIDMAVRNGKYLESLPEEIVSEVLARILPIFN